MDTTLRRRALTTKLRPPATGVRYMPRPRLFQAASGELPVRLVLVAAPAGSGKTSVLAEWYQHARERGADAAWLSIDDFDNEPRRFLSHLILAVQEIRPGLGAEALGILAANPQVPMEYLADSLVHDLGSGAGMTVFLDDYHEIRDRAIHAVVDFLLRYAPPETRFVIGSRKVPPLFIERLRGRGELREVGWEELRFRTEEARGYMNDVCRLGLSDAQVRALCKRTEGWVTGLQLAAMAVAGTGDADRIVTSITGEQKNIAGYLMEGVFRRQGAAMRQFLMKTSILERLTGGLCDAVTGRRDGRQHLETLENGNLFVFGLDDQRTWYRYHHLFSEFLRNRLRTEMPGEVDGLYDRASEWFERNGFPRAAVRHAIAGRRHERAARLLETAGRERFRQGDFKELRRWIEALPEDTVRGSAALCTLHAWALGYLGEFEAARARISCAEASVPAEPGSPALAELRVLRAVLGIIRTDEPVVDGLHPGIPSCFPPEEAALRGYASITLGFACRVSGDLPGALQHYREALACTDDADSSLVHLNARLNIGTVHYLMGRMNEAERSFRESLDVAAQRLWLRSIGASFLRYGLALVLHEKNRLTEALQELSEAISFLESVDAFGFLGMALVERARTHFTLGRPDLAASDVAYARQVALEHDVERVSFRADLLEARMAVQAGEAGKAAVFLAAAEGSLRDKGGRTVFTEKQEGCLVERLRLLIARKQFGEASRLAAKALRSATAAQRGRNVVEFLLLQAVAADGLMRREKALASLGEAVNRAGGEGILRPFCNVGGRILPLLRQLEGNRRFRAPAAPILAALRDRGVAVFPKAAPGDGEQEPLHQREVQILDLIARGLRNREIGKRLFLSEETVKWYLKRLYCKLYVGTRTEAIAKARRLGILS